MLAPAPARFWCQRFACELTVSCCVTRQTRETYQHAQKRMVAEFPECAKCAQGAEHMANWTGPIIKKRKRSASFATIGRKR